ncbi:3-deoxy-D-manno-octulosonic acid transferase [Synergistales bacterium]|nr:3-deoxy-D-manno-octulosonic acid transferase [Synergistales bacterium]
MKLFLYRALTFLVKPLVRPILALRRMKGLESKDLERRRERFGVSSIPRPGGLIFWFAVSSVGEGNSAIPIIDYILELYPDAHILVTTGTVTGDANMEKKLSGKRAFHQFLPFDRRAYVLNFLEYWMPSVGFFVDSEFWPNLLLEISDRKIPLILLNGRVSDRSYYRWMKSPKIISCLTRPFVYALAKSEWDEKKLSRMGIAKVACVGNIKYGAPPLTFDREALISLSGAVGARKLWVAAVTHSGEDEIILRSHRAVMSAFPNSILILVPRHSARGDEIESTAQKEGFRTARASKGETIGNDASVYISDVFGELGLYYAFSDIVFLGGSLLPSLHGHNPIEPAQLRAALLSGRNVDSFLETYEVLERENAVILVGGVNDLGEWVTRLMSDPELLSGYRERAFGVAARASVVLERVREKLRPILEVALKGH